MDQSLEATADIATGLVVASVVESADGAGTSATGAQCLNCGAVLGGSFCTACGQSAHIHRSLTAFWHDFTHSIFHFEGKIWRTLPMLAFAPGKLTRRYVHGERARFVSPLALFLFSVFLMFASFKQFADPFGSGGKPNFDTIASAGAGLAKGIPHAQDRIARLVEQRAQLAASGAPLNEIDRQLVGAREELLNLQRGLEFTKNLDGKGSATPKEMGIVTGSPELDVKLSNAIKNPALLLYKVQANAYKFSWLVIPLSLPFLGLMFAWRRQYKLYDHLIFITYSLSFFTFLFALVAMIETVPWLNWTVTPLLIFAPPAHMFVQLKHAYALGNREALWRTIVMLGAAALVLVLFALILLALGVAG